MAFRPATHIALVSTLSVAAVLAATPRLCAQVFVVGEKTAMADVSTDFHPTRVELPTDPINELDRRTLVRDLEAEQGFAHRILPLAENVTLVANGNLTPNGDAYKEMLYKKGQSAAPGDRVAITTVTFKANLILLDINGGPYLKHRILRHIELNGIPVVADDGTQVTGFRITLLFEGSIPNLSAPEVKALLYPLIDFGVHSSAQAYADSLPPFLKTAIDHHDALVGMDRRMVLAACGEPESKIRELLPGSTTEHYEEWIYGQMPETVRFVRFIGDRVAQVRVAALGKPIVLYTTDQLHGYLPPDQTHEIALGDNNSPTTGDANGQAPTLRNPGDPVAPGSDQRVHFPPPSQNDKPAATPQPPVVPADVPPASPPDASAGAPPGPTP